MRKLSKLKAVSRSSMKPGRRTSPAREDEAPARPKMWTPDSFQAWLDQRGEEPYLHDAVLQNIGWVANITRAIQKEEGGELESSLRPDLDKWRRLLDLAAVAHAIGPFTLGPGLRWQDLEPRVRSWLDSRVNDPVMDSLLQSGAGILHDAFASLQGNVRDPSALAIRVLGSAGDRSGARRRPQKVGGPRSVRRRRSTSR